MKGSDMKKLVPILSVMAAFLSVVSAQGNEVILGETRLFRPAAPNPPSSDTDWLDIRGSIC